MISATGPLEFLLFCTNLSHQIMPAAVGQSNVAQDRVERLGAERGQRFLHAARVGNVKTEVNKEARQDPTRVVMVFNEENAEVARIRLRWPLNV